MKKIKPFLLEIILIIVSAGSCVFSMFFPEIFGMLFYTLFKISLTYNQATAGGIIMILLISLIIYIIHCLIKKRMRSKRT